jgi:hypothetical protein
MVLSWIPRYVGIRVNDVADIARLSLQVTFLPFVLDFDFRTVLCMF